MRPCLPLCARDPGLQSGAEGDALGTQRGLAKNRRATASVFVPGRGRWSQVDADVWGASEEEESVRRWDR